MKRAAAERKIVVVLFVLVLVTFTLAQRDSRRLHHFSAAVTTQVKQLLTYATPGK